MYDGIRVYATPNEDGQWHIKGIIVDIAEPDGATRTRKLPGADRTYVSQDEAIAVGRTEAKRRMAAGEF